MKQVTILTGLCLLLALPLTSRAQEQEPENTLTLNASVMARGELRYGGLPQTDEGDEKEARFLLERTRLGVDYQRKWLEVKVTAQHSGVWGQKGKGSFNLSDTWVKLTAKNGLFAQVGRQSLAYDDERILGSNDWSMTPYSHDALRLGYEGHGHKAHVILAYNQKEESTNGGTDYTTEDGAYPHKSLVTAWYHYDLPHTPLGLSLLFMNIGMQRPEQQSSDEDIKTEFQQLLGGFVSFRPERWNVEASYYRQMGKDEFHIPIQAWMASIKTEFTPNTQWKLTAGYDYLSGDDNPVVPKIGAIGLVRHEKVKGFSSVFGSHHRFYGLMDFFYVSAYYGGYTPGMQNWYLGASYKPIKPLTLSAQYHYLSTASKIDNADRTLGNEIELEANYQIMKDVSLSAGYSFMKGSSTLERLQRVEGRNKLHWAWIMLSVSPTIFTTKW